MPSDHALLGASGSGKWLKCTPSARLEASLPNDTSDEATEGTKAHDLMEIWAKAEFHGWAIPTELSTVEGRRAQGFTQEMEDAVLELIEEVREIVASLKKAGVPFTILIEQRLDFSPWVPEGFGTGDIVIVAGHCIWVRDLKYGKGVRVESEENTQMMLYGLGAYNELSFAYDGINELDLGISQPRLGSRSSWRVSLTNLLEWGEMVKPIAQLAWEGKGEFVPGPHCDECFCRARATCLARVKMVIDAAVQNGDRLLGVAEMDALLPVLDWVTSWANRLREDALAKAVSGEVEFPNHKLVEGRSNRFISDKPTAAVRLVANGVPKEKIFTNPEPELLGITALQEAAAAVGLKKKAFEDLLEGLLIKPAGKPTLVHVSDSRKPLVVKRDADEDFGD